LAGVGWSELELVSRGHTSGTNPDLQTLVLTSWWQNLVPKRQGITGLESFCTVNVGGTVAISAPGKIHFTVSSSAR